MRWARISCRRICSRRCRWPLLLGDWAGASFVLSSIRKHTVCWIRERSGLCQENFEVGRNYEICTGASDVDAESFSAAVPFHPLKPLKDFVQEKLASAVHNYTTSVPAPYAVQLEMMAWNACRRRAEIGIIPNVLEEYVSCNNPRRKF